MVSQEEIITQARQENQETQRIFFQALDFLARGESTAFLRAGTSESKRALILVQQWEQTPEGRQAIMSGELQAVESQRTGFGSVTEFRQVSGFAGQERLPDIPEQPRSSFVTESGAGMSISREELNKAIERGQITESGTFKDVKGQTFQVSVAKKSAGEERTKAQFEKLAEETKARTEKEFKPEFIQRIQENIAQTQEAQERDRLLRDFERQATIPDLLRTGDVPSAVRRGARLGGTAFFIGTEKIRTGVPALFNIKVEEIPTHQKVIIGETIGEIGLFLGISPVTPSTIQTQKALQQTGVKFIGAKQNIKSGDIKTEVLFTTTRGEQGIAGALTRVKTIGNVTISKTDVIGGILQKAIKFPTGKFIIQPKSAFGTRQAGVGISLTERISKDISAGKIIIREGGRKIEDIFISRGFGFKGKEQNIVFSVGETITQKTTGGGSIGLIGKLPSKEKIRILTKVPKDAGTITQKQVLALQQTQAGITAGVQTPPKISTIGKATLGSVVSIGKIDTAGGVSPAIKTPSLTKQKITISQAISPAQSISTRQFITTAQVPRARQKTKQEERQAVTPAQQIKLKTGQKQAISLRFRQVQQPVQRRPFAPSISFRTPAPRGRIGGRIGIETRIPKQQRGTGLFGVSVRRRGKFRTIGKVGSISQAITIGTTRVRGTLGATFKITPLTKGTISGGIRTPRGFRQKRGLVFIEKRGQRLSTGTERIEIQRAKKRKRKSKGGKKK